jgi:hypothetical protein
VVVKRVGDVVVIRQSRGFDLRCIAPEAREKDFSVLPAFRASVVAFIVFPSFFAFLLRGLRG